MTQYVLLGAGLDTFAHRNPYPQLRVIEVDHPATQGWKRELLRNAGLPCPARLTYASVDFERQLLATQLVASVFDRTVPSFFAWLGVVPYLSREAFRRTIDFIAVQPSGSGVIFDYCQPRAALAPNEQLARDSLAARLQLAGEDFRSFFTRDEIATELSGFSSIEDLDSEQINARYFTNRTDTLQLRGTATRFVCTWRCTSEPRV